MRALVAASVLAVTAAAPSRARADGAVEVPGTGGPTPRVVYLDRCPQGCTITRAAPGGADDARADVSSVVPTGGALTPLPRLDLAWAGLVICLGDVLGPYGIELATEEPAPDVDYVEVKISGLPEELGLPAGTRGLAPRGDDCAPVARGVAFVFGNLWDLTDIIDAPVDLCGHVAHQLGHVLGLDDVGQCRDVMTPGDACADRSFADLAAPCGAPGAPRPCACGGATQNGHAALRAVLGAGAGPAPPHVALVAPAAGATVEDDVEVAFDVTAARPLDRLELWVDGALVAEAEPAEPAAARQRLRWTAGAPGDHVVEARALDDLGRLGGAAATVTWQDGGCASSRGGAGALAPLAAALALALGVLRRRSR